ncbi:MAG: ATP-binding cassette domain-containing protein [Candidatus Eisenbacteria bacterium]|nr:ATP-binding cassette domain-containing protein [Candidatus Eisenbacteria bacterium]
MLEVRDVVKTYDGRAVVNRVSFEVPPGEIFALLGPNGAGKTTLIRMITDILRPDSGEIRLDGQVVGGDAKRRIAYLPEERGLYRRVKVVEALAYFGELKGLVRQAARQEALDLLARVDLREWADKQVQALSKGMQQKVQLCTTLIGDPRLLILDEPFAGLDPLNTQMFEEILHERRAAGCTVLLSTHQMNKVEELCDRALMINHGFMVLYGTLRDIRREYADHAVVVRTERAPGAMPGVNRIEPVNGDWKLTLEPEATPQAVLGALVERGVPVESFAIATLPLEDIFVKVVREGRGLDRGQSGPPAGAAGEAGPATATAKGGAR